MSRQNWVGKVENLVVTTENSGTDWAIVRLNNSSGGVPEWFALELSHRTPTSMAMFNLLRDAAGSSESVRIVVNRRAGHEPDWQEAIVLAVESPHLPAEHTKEFR